MIAFVRRPIWRFGYYPLTAIVNRYAFLDACFAWRIPQRRNLDTFSTCSVSQPATISTVKKQKKNTLSGNAIPVLRVTQKRGLYVFRLFFKIDLCSAIFKKSRRELSIDVTALKNYQNTQYPRFSNFILKTGIAFPKTGVCFYCVPHLIVSLSPCIDLNARVNLFLKVFIGYHNAKRHRLPQ